MSKLIIHRGTQEIGGSAVEINNGETRLLFDFGVPLDSMVKDEWQPEDYKLPISGLYKDETPEQRKERQETEKLIREWRKKF